MKKKLGLLFLSFGLVALAGCSGGSNEDLNVLRSDTPSQELIDKYKIADLTNDNKKVVFSDEKSQYTVYAATNTEGSLFVKENDVTLYFEDHPDKVDSSTIAPMYFDSSVNQIYSSESSEILSALYNENQGISKLTYGIDSSLILTDANFNKTVSFKAATIAYKEAKNTVTVQALYLPTFVVRKLNGVEILRKYIFVPVYYEVIYNGKVIKLDEEDNKKYVLSDSKISSFPKLSVVFDEHNYIVG